MARLLPGIAGSVALGVLCLCASDGKVMRITSSTVTFLSEAELERITATSEQASGVLDKEERTFVVQIPLHTFQGFNSPLQREHFGESYVESAKYPLAMFKGRIIEAVDFSKPGHHAVRAKGKFSIHGIEKERIIKCDLTIGANEVMVVSKFDVLLADHNIRIPHVVHQKISPVIQVSVDLRFATPPSSP